MTNWYTADTHFGHESVIGFCDRPFANASQMDVTLIEKARFVVDHRNAV